MSAPIFQISFNGFWCMCTRAHLKTYRAIVAFDMLSRCWPKASLCRVKHTISVKSCGGERGVEHGIGGWRGVGEGGKEREERAKAK